MNYTKQYIQTKLKQAEMDVVTFTMLLEEIVKVEKELQSKTLNNKFLTLITNKKEELI